MALRAGDAGDDVLGAARHVRGTVLGAVVGGARLEGGLHQVGAELAAHRQAAVLSGRGVELAHHAGTGRRAHVERRGFGRFDANGYRFG